MIVWEEEHQVLGSLNLYDELGKKSNPGWTRIYLWPQSLDTQFLYNRESRVVNPYVIVLGHMQEALLVILEMELLP